MTHSDCTVSIICHSALEECKRCLLAVLASRGGAKLILTANGNMDAATYFEGLAAEHENIQVVVNRQNLGFIGPSNHAFSLCSTDLFVLLNDDAVPPPDWLAKLKDALEPTLAIISGPTERHLNADFIGRPVTRTDGADFIEGSCMMIDVASLRLSLEPLFADDLSWAYTEDADLCLRVRKMGFTIHKADFTLFHRAGTTTRTVPHLHSIMRNNFAVCKRRWAGYLKTRTFE